MNNLDVDTATIANFALYLAAVATITAVTVFATEVTKKKTQDLLD